MPRGAGRPAAHAPGRSFSHGLLMKKSPAAPVQPNLMAEAMRWFGPSDSVTLAEIRQTGATETFSALHEIPYGEAWPAEAIVARRDEIAGAGLKWAVVESVPVHESIKTRTGDFARHIENYKPEEHTSQLN